MKSIKGPRSALTDFIEEAGIKIPSKKDTPVKLQGPEQIEKKQKKPKKVKIAKPVELVNYKSNDVIAEEEKIKGYLDRLEEENLNYQELEQLSMYLTRNRIMNEYYFDYLCRRVTNSLTIHDCSKIKDADYLKIGSLKKINLHQCGQITENTLNIILKRCERLEELRLTGAYLLETFDLPRNIKTLDLSYCTRLENSFLDQLNNTYSHLDELRLSYCYGLNSMAQISVDVDKLFICETLLSTDHLKKIEDIEYLSVKKCLNVNSIPTFTRIKYLDVEAIVTLNDLLLPASIEHLNVSHCQNIRNIFYPNLKYLNISHINFSSEELEEIFNCKKLEILDCSWNPNLNDEFLKRILTVLPIKKLYVFGCFQLTKLSSKYAYENINNCEVIGNPSETIFLLEDG